MFSFALYHSLDVEQHAANEVLEVLYVYLFYQKRSLLGLPMLDGCLPATFLFIISIGTASRPLQRCDVCGRQIILHFFGTVAQSTVMYGYCALLNVHVISQLFLGQFHIPFTILGGNRGENVQCNSARISP